MQAFFTDFLHGFQRLRNAMPLGGPSRPAAWRHIPIEWPPALSIGQGRTTFSPARTMFDVDGAREQEVVEQVWIALEAL